MTRRNEDHEVAKIIKGLEKRLADLEEKDRSSATPNLLRTVRDQVVADDSDITVVEHTLETGLWSRYSPSGGYGEGGYGEGGYGESETSSGTSTAGWKTSTWGSYE